MDSQCIQCNVNHCKRVAKMLWDVWNHLWYLSNAMPGILDSLMYEKHLMLYYSMSTGGEYMTISRSSSQISDGSSIPLTPDGHGFPSQ